MDKFAPINLEEFGPIWTSFNQVLRFFLLLKYYLKIFRYMSFTKQLQDTLVKMGLVMDFDTCRYGGSLGGLEMMDIIPKMLLFKIPRGRLKKSHFKDFFT